MNRPPFTFIGYHFDADTYTATFRYAFDTKWQFEEKLIFESIAKNYDAKALDRALFLMYMVCGTSYYKTFPSREVVFAQGELDEWQSTFFNTVYQEGLSQFAYENMLNRDDLAHFVPTGTASTAVPYTGTGILALQSGGKDSLLTASLLQEKGLAFTPWYVTNNPSHPTVLDTLGTPLRTVTRTVDIQTLKKARAEGGLNGHVPVTYIVMSIALIDAILHNENTILVSIGHEGDEPHTTIGDLPVNHQWAKTWDAEVEFAEYVRRYISPDIRIGSPLRSLSELRIAEFFAQHAWKHYGHQFSSCNVANYAQGKDNTSLAWCGECPKCANSFLLFAPFVEPAELMSIFGGTNLMQKESLTETFKGLLGIDDVMKPLECVGEVSELRRAYHLAQEKWPHAHYTLPFEVPPSHFDYQKEYLAQEEIRSILFPAR